MATNKSAVDDGKRVRTREIRPNPRAFKLNADEVVATIKRHIGRVMGPRIEKRSDVFGIQGGYFFVMLPADAKVNKTIRDKFWRMALKEGMHLRRQQIGLALRAIHGETLTDPS